VRAGRTTFVIAHRLWTVQQADQILVLREGRIVERAHSTPERSAHQALLAAGGFYGQVYALQFQAETAGGGAR
jgi:ABC-type transport system involved in Fe-S cluster assembly fused permease/ATPase subunit